MTFLHRTRSFITTPKENTNGIHKPLPLLPGPTACAFAAVENVPIPRRRTTTTPTKTLMRRLKAKTHLRRASVIPGQGGGLDIIPLVKPTTTWAVRSFNLPAEVIAVIVSYLPRHVVASLAPLSRSFSDAARLALYTTLDLQTLRRLQLEKLVAALASRPDLTELVHHFICRTWPSFFSSSSASPHASCLRPEQFVEASLPSSSTYARQISESAEQRLSLRLSRILIPLSNTNASLVLLPTTPHQPLLLPNPPPKSDDPTRYTLPRPFPLSPFFLFHVPSKTVTQRIANDQHDALYGVEACCVDGCVADAGSVIQNTSSDFTAIQSSTRPPLTLRFVRNGGRRFHTSFSAPSPPLPISPKFISFPLTCTRTRRNVSHSSNHIVVVPIPNNNSIHSFPYFLFSFSSLSNTLSHSSTFPIPVFAGTSPN
ncbi:uncharacterized protein LACBIDRAFT_294735 [Laccaria bicolor S238N-H82]|uniref:Predicted protein n=1 Tax=Laccaria bicolor (strain S238N-H82 / ATCC MYA-4686) TaxID=486041 RepID=B0DHD0_LACBS|nr:uncharacterized protein LACBIDRAFT_294735 [Laccaria bicolor S238N-H82]EDR05993.1 predicted protein [Laccaria bicolor S238N-H82]|eukprot:XP_001883281.1 predicted protein [Laccaria bicolor S238N-H82]